MSGKKYLNAFLPTLRKRYQFHVRPKIQKGITSGEESRAPGRIKRRSAPRRQT